jgi:hypothetical protein
MTERNKRDQINDLKPEHTEVPKGLLWAARSARPLGAHGPRRLHQKAALPNLQQSALTC